MSSVSPNSFTMNKKSGNTTMESGNFGDRAAAASPANVNDRSEILPHFSLPSSKEEEMLEIIKNKSKIFIDKRFPSVSMFEYVKHSTTISEFLQIAQRQIVDFLSEILTLRSKITEQSTAIEEKEKIESSLERRIDDNLMENAVEAEKQQIEMQRILNAFSLVQQVCRILTRPSNHNRSTGKPAAKRSYRPALVNAAARKCGWINPSRSRFLEGGKVRD